MIDAVMIFWTRRFHSHFSLSFYMLGGKIQEMGKFVCLFIPFSSPLRPLGNNSCEQRNFTRKLLNFPERKKKGRSWWSGWTRPEPGESEAHHHDPETSGCSLPPLCPASSMPCLLHWCYPHFLESQNPICASVWIKWLPSSIPKCGFPRDLSKACSQHQEEA